jgi:hypothetical protein
MPSTSQQPPISLDADRDAKRPVVIRPEDNDLFVRTGKQVIDACRLGISLDLWLQELGAMIGEVRKWIDERAQLVRFCYCAPRGARIALYFVPTGEEFNFDLADDLAELTTRLVKQFNVGMVESLQIPFSDIDRFLSPDVARQV